MKQICKSGSDVCIVWTPYFQLISLPWIYKNIITGQSDFRNLPSLLHGRHCDTDMFCVFTWKTLIQTCSVYLQGGHRYRHVLCIYMEDTDTHMFCVFTWKTLIQTCSVYFLLVRSLSLASLFPLDVLPSSPRTSFNRPRKRLYKSGFAATTEK